MKKILSFIIIVSMLLTFFTGFEVFAADELDRSNPEDLATLIFKRIDAGDDPVLKEGVKLYKSGDSIGALKCYRNYFIEKMRRTEIAYYPYYTPSSENLMLQADVVCGIKSLEDYYAVFPDNTWFDDCLGAHGSPYVERKINWLGGMGKARGSGYFGGGQDVFLSWIGMMGAAYYKSGGEKIYMDKFFQVAADFAINCKKDIDAYEASTPEIATSKRDARTWQWPGIHGNNERSGFLRGCVVQFSKLLPAEGETEMPKLNSWDDIVKPFGKANPEFYDLIDPVKFASYSVGMIDDVIPMLLLGFRADIAANQRNSAARGCAVMLALYSEFPHLDKIKNECAEYLLNIWGMMYQDGTFLEQSLNYNDDEANGNKSIVDLYESSGVKEEWMDNYGYSTKLYFRFRDAFLSNALLLPKVGNGGDSPRLPEIWKDEETLNKYKAYVGYTHDVDPLPFDTIFFPWGGYATLRSGWDIKDGMTLGFYNPETSGTGHASLIKNCVWLTAYGRPLIQSGEGNIYSAADIPEDQRDDYQSWQKYFGEEASRKGSTIMVNDKDQRRDLPGTRERTTTRGYPTVQARFLDGNNFDYIDGNFACGYTGGGTRIDDTKHIRQNFFVRDADVWIINDTMKNEGASVYEYSQIWRFPAKSDDTELQNGVGYNFSGFENEEVVIDEKNNSIKTQDKGTVNLFMTQFSNEELSYQKYYGSKGEEDGDGVFRGWTSKGINGKRAPSPDVYVRWSDKNSKNSQVMTFAMPSKTDAQPYKELKDMSNAETGITGFELITNEDKKVISLSSAVPAVLTASGISVKAKNMVITEIDGVVNGVLIDCESIITDGKETPSTVKDFEFTVKNGKIELVNEITIPQSFGWVETEDGKYYPRYDCYTMPETDELKAKFNSMVDGIRVIKYSDSEYIVKKVEDDLVEAIELYRCIENVGILSEREAMASSLEEFGEKIVEIAEFYGKNEFNKKISVHFRSFSDSMNELAKEINDDRASEISDFYLAAAVALENGKYDISVYFENINDYREAEKTFVDISESWAKNDIEYMVEKGFISGESDTEFNPQGKMTRAQMMASLMRILGIEGKYSGEFKDVTASDWYADAVSAAVSRQIISGDNGYFRPDDFVTREEAAKMIALAGEMTSEKKAEFSDKEEISQWAAVFVSAVNENGIMKGYPDGSFKPKADITRAEGTVMLKRVYEKINVGK